MTIPDDWTYFDGPIGPCVICSFNCRSLDPAQVMRHPLCDEVRVTADLPDDPLVIETAEALTLECAR